MKTHLPSFEVLDSHLTDDLFKSLITCPVERGFAAGVFGNGWIMHQVHQWYSGLLQGHHLPYDWTICLDQGDASWIRCTKKLDTVIYYQCPTCPQYWL
jgi:hypothetical protein